MKVGNWARLLHTAVKEKNAYDFAWGAHDCFTLAFDLVAVQTGTDPLARWRGRYTTGRGALRHIREYLGGIPEGIEMVEAVMVKLMAENGFQEVQPLNAMRGDLLLLSNVTTPPFTQSLGVCLGERAVSVGWGPAHGGGTALVPMADALRVWRVS